MKDTKTDQAILEGGLGAPIVHGDFRLYEAVSYTHLTLPTNREV